MKSVALVLSSGGSRGVAQIGAINELEKHGFNITSVAGSSIGAVIGGIYVMGKLPEYSSWVKTLNRKAVWELMDFTLTSNGLLKGDRVIEKMKTFIPDMKIEDMKIPLSVVATDILNEKEVVFKSGNFYDAIRASIAIPAILTPIKHNNTILVDGGILNPIPIEHIIRNNGDLLVVVNLYGDNEVELEEINQKTNNINSFLDTIYKVIDTNPSKNLGYLSLLKTTSYFMIRKIAKLNIEKYNPDILINIPRNSADTFDFHKADELMNIGAEATKIAIINYFDKNGH